ncbi:uncharacterized protein LOC141657696 [Silene latifolia]|uniref:uncharacterized protein LOC141657696 n=1 Tax=Silene latifolia TaxID=37657 RepID=UPI003D77B9CA
MTSEIRKYEPSPESITTVEEADIAEAQLEEVLTQVQERMKELSVNEGNPESLPNDFMTGSEDSLADSPNQAELDDDSDEDQAEMANQVAVAAASSAVTAPERHGSPNPFLELAITDSFTSLLLQADQVDQADVPQPPSPIRETVSQASVQNLFGSVYDNHLKRLQDCLLNTSNTLNADQTTEVIQSSDNIETPDDFIFPSANLPSLDYQLPPQTELGESNNNAAINNPQRQANITSTWEINAFRDLLTSISATKNPQFSPGFWYMPPPNELYSSAFEMMGLAVDPHFRYYEDITGKGARLNNQQ